jgi:hypothetical protein
VKFSLKQIQNETDTAVMTRTHSTLALCLAAVFFALPARGTPGLWFDRVFIIVFENNAYAPVLADTNFQSFSTGGRLLTNYYAVVHPSQPNYLSMIAGHYFGFADNNARTYNGAPKQLVDLMEAKGISWKTYQENYPGGCFNGDSAPYFRRHNPFISFSSISSNATRCANIVPATQFDADISSGNLPDYMFYTPNVNNDGHDTSIAFAGNYLVNTILPKLALLPTKTLIVAIFDEDNSAAENKVYGVLRGSMIPAGSSDNTFYSHFSLLATVEQNWNLGNLDKFDKDATPFFSVPVTPPVCSTLTSKRVVCTKYTNAIASAGTPPSTPLLPAVFPFRSCDIFGDSSSEKGGFVVTSNLCKADIISSSEVDYLGISGNIAKPTISDPLTRYTITCSYVSGVTKCWYSIPSQGIFQEGDVFGGIGPSGSQVVAFFPKGCSPTCDVTIDCFITTGSVSG